MMISLAAFFYLYEFGLERIKPETISAAISGLGYWGPMLYIVLNTLRPLFFFPAIVLAVAGGLAYGPLWGSVYLIAGTMLGACLCFGLSRWLGRDKICHHIPKQIHFEAINARLELQGFKTLLLLRLVPLIPWDAVSFMAGLTQVRFWPYFLATLFGSIPGAVLFCYLGNALNRSLFAGLWAVVASLVVMSCLPLLWRSSSKRQRNHSL